MATNATRSRTRPAPACRLEGGPPPSLLDALGALQREARGRSLEVWAGSVKLFSIERPRSDASVLQLDIDDRLLAA